MILSELARKRLNVHQLHVVAGMELLDPEVAPWDLAIGRITPAERFRVSPWFRGVDELVTWLDSPDFDRAIAERERLR